jgi:hypothetical protein
LPNAGIMENPDGLEVAIDGDEIVVTTPGNCLIAYAKLPHKPELILIRSWLAPISSPGVSEFRAQALQAAAAKARELGWMA